MYNAVVVANTILRIREEQSGLIGPMDKIRLHRFCYFAQGWYLARFDQPLFDNPIERWGVGPVIQEVIIRYHEYGDNPIHTHDKELSFIAPMKDQDVSFLEALLHGYRFHKTRELSTLVKDDEQYWNSTIPFGSEIPKQMLRRIFTARAEASAAISRAKESSRKINR